MLTAVNTDGRMSLLTAINRGKTGVYMKGTKTTGGIEGGQDDHAIGASSITFKRETKMPGLQQTLDICL